MAGIGRQIVRGLGAAMTGFGKGMEQVHNQEQKERESQALLDREMALATFRFQKGEISADNQVGRTKQIDANRAELSVGSHAATSRIDAGHAAESDQRREAAQARADHRRGVIELMVAEGKSKVEIAAELQRQRLYLGEYAPKAEKEDKPTKIETVQGPDGQYYSVMSDGSQIPLAGTPVAVKNKDGGRDLTAERGARGGGDGEIATNASNIAGAANRAATSIISSRQNPVVVNSRAEADRLPTGSYFIAAGDPTRTPREKTW